MLCFKITITASNSAEPEDYVNIRFCALCAKLSICDYIFSSWYRYIFATSSCRTQVKNAGKKAGEITTTEYKCLRKKFTMELKFNFASVRVDGFLFVYKCKSCGKNMFFNGPNRIASKNCQYHNSCFKIY